MTSSVTVNFVAGGIRTRLSVASAVQPSAYRIVCLYSRNRLPSSRPAAAVVAAHVGPLTWRMLSHAPCQACMTMYRPLRLKLQNSLEARSYNPSTRQLVLRFPVGRTHCVAAAGMRIKELSRSARPLEKAVASYTSCTARGMFHHANCKCVTMCRPHQNSPNFQDYSCPVAVGAHMGVENCLSRETTLHFPCSDNSRRGAADRC